ncbi:S1C family serine protease [Nocardioides sp. DS6]|uniref:S1C family serine protease n=1 Tax=Nocardioides eburneus TaxID=3231482 RepID=A0ABV3T2I7_9ACTN
MATDRSPRSRRRLRHTLAATALAIPLVALPAVVPAAASAVDDRGYAPGYGYAYGDTGADGSGSYWDGGDYGGYGSYGSGGSYGGYGSYGGDSAGGSGGGWSTYGLPGDGWTQQSTTQTTDTEPASASESRGVVLVDTVLDYGDGAAAGTGLVLSSDGIVATNHHVVEGATKITVTVPGGKSYTARVLGYDSVHDVALLQLEGASGLTTVTTDKAAVSTGEQVTSVGNAEGEGKLVAADGTVTDPSTPITVTEEDGSSARLTGLIEVDADVVSGDSGGALLDADGEVVGMNVAASSGGTDISGYAIPISRVLDIAAQILTGEESGDVEIGYDAALGVQLYDGSTPQVAGVVEGGAAASAGVTAGSTITSFDKTTVSSVDDLTSALAEHEPGDRVALVWTDASGARHSATVTLGRAPVA